MPEGSTWDGRVLKFIKNLCPAHWLFIEIVMRIQNLRIPKGRRGLPAVIFLRVFPLSWQCFWKIMRFWPGHPNQQTKRNFAYLQKDLTKPKKQKKQKNHNLRENLENAKTHDAKTRFLFFQVLAQIMVCCVCLVFLVLPDPLGDRRNFEILAGAFGAEFPES